MGKNSKRPKSYYINSPKRRKINNELAVNMTGFLCTCNMKEKECIKEAYNILNEFANSLYGEETSSEKSEKINSSGTEIKSSNTPNEVKSCEKNMSANEVSSDSDSEDIESALKNEVEALQKSNKAYKGRNRFQQMSVRVNNCIFISTTIPNPVELSLAIMDNLLEHKKARTQHLVRMVPVQKTCKAFVEDIEKASKEIIFDHFPKYKTSFYIAFRTRNNNSLQREIILKSLSDIICEYNLEAFADYKTPNFVLNVDVLKNICCLGLLPQYLTKYCKYNLLKLVHQDKVEDGSEIMIGKDTDTTGTDNGDQGRN